MKQEIPKPTDLPLKLVTDELNAHTQSLLTKLTTKIQGVEQELSEINSSLSAREFQEFRPDTKGDRPVAGMTMINPQDALRKAEMEAQGKWSAKVYEMRKRRGDLETKIENLNGIISVFRGAIMSLRIVNPGDLGATNTSPGGGATVTSIFGLASGHGNDAILDVFLKGAAFAPDSHPELVSRDPRLCVSLAIARIPFHIVDGV